MKKLKKQNVIVISIFFKESTEAIILKYLFGLSGMVH